MSAFYASKVDKVAAAGEAHNDVMRARYPSCEDRLQALNLNVKLALVGDSQVRHQLCQMMASSQAHRSRLGMMAMLSRFFSQFRRKYQYVRLFRSIEFQ